MDDLSPVHDALPPAPPTPSTGPSLLSLPPEIKLEIVKLVDEEWFPNTGSPFRVERNHAGSDRVRAMGVLLLSCKELSEMAQAVFWNVRTTAKKTVRGQLMRAHSTER